MSYTLSDNTLRTGISHCLQQHTETQVDANHWARTDKTIQLHKRKREKLYMCSHARPVRVAAETGRCVPCACVSVQTFHSAQAILRDSSWWCKTDGPFYATSASELNFIKATHTDLTSLQYFLLWWASASQKDSRKQYKELWIWHFKSQTFALSKMPLKTKAKDTNRFSWMNFLGAMLYNILTF